MRVHPYPRHDRSGSGAQGAMFEDERPDQGCTIQPEGGRKRLRVTGDPIEGKVVRSTQTVECKSCASKTDQSVGDVCGVRSSTVQSGDLGSVDSCQVKHFPFC